jgi:FkbM family methyltransferase
VHSLERICIQVRHSRRLDGVDWLWDILRGPYNHLVGLYGADGLKRVMNGTDALCVLPECRTIVETYEPDVWRQLMLEVRAGDVVVDVGAHVGLYSVALALRVGRAGRVVAFEPNPSSFQTLRTHCRINRVLERVELRDVAVGDVDGEVAFESGRGSESSISVSPGSTERVNCARLDTVFPNQRVDLLKIDIEGYEERALRGAAGLLRDVHRRPRAIFIEIHPYAWTATGTTSDSLLDFLSSVGYEVTDLNGQPVSRLTGYGEVVAKPRAQEMTEVA